MVKFDREEVQSLYARYTPMKTPVIEVSKTRTRKRVDLRRYEVTDLVMKSYGGIELQEFKFTHEGLAQRKQAWKTGSRFRICQVF